MALGPKSQRFRRLCFSFLFHHKMALERFTCSCFHFIAQGRRESEIYPWRTLKGTAPLLTLGLTLLHSLRCLKSAFSLQNMSLIPSAVSGSCRSTLASAVNLRKQNPTLVTATVTSGMFFRAESVTGLTWGWAGAPSSCASVWSNSALWRCWCAGWPGTEGCPPQRGAQSACWWCCPDRAAQSPYTSDLGAWWPYLAGSRRSWVERWTEKVRLSNTQSINNNILQKSLSPNV